MAWVVNFLTWNTRVLRFTWFVKRGGDMVLTTPMCEVILQDDGIEDETLIFS